MEIWELNDLQYKIAHLLSEGFSTNKMQAIKRLQARTNFLSRATGVEEEVIKEFISILYDVPKELPEIKEEHISIPDDNSST